MQLESELLRPHRLIIAGSRGLSISDEEISDAVFTMGIHVTEVVSGLAPGPDSDGKRWAERWGIPVTEFPANWKKYGKAAGPLRNKQMADYGDYLLAFWDGESRGTADMIQRMNLLGKPGYVVTVAKRALEPRPGIDTGP